MPEIDRLKIKNRIPKHCSQCYESVKEKSKRYKKRASLENKDQDIPQSRVFEGLCKHQKGHESPREDSSHTNQKPVCSKLMKNCMAELSRAVKRAVKNKLQNLHLFENAIAKSARTYIRQSPSPNKSNLYYKKNEARRLRSTSMTVNEKLGQVDSSQIEILYQDIYERLAQEQSQEFKDLKQDQEATVPSHNSVNKELKQRMGDFTEGIHGKIPITHEKNTIEPTLEESETSEKANDSIGRKRLTLIDPFQEVSDENSVEFQFNFIRGKSRRFRRDLEQEFRTQDITGSIDPKNSGK